MSGNFIINTPRHQMHALAFQGIMVTDCHHQLRDMLRRRLGDGYVLLFAEPSFNTGDQSVDWYTPVQGVARQLTELPAEEQNALRDRLLHMAQEMRAFAEDLKRSSEQTRVTRGNILELALRYPDDSCLFAVGGQPVITCWGFGPGTFGAEPQDLCRISRLAPAIAPQAVTPPVAPAAPDSSVQEVPSPRQTGSYWEILWWSLPLLLLLLLLYLLFTSFGGKPAIGGTALFQAPLPPFCQPVEDPDQKGFSSLKSKIQALENEIAFLHARLDEHLALCRPQATEPAIPAPAVQEEKPLIIPSDPENMSFLEGYWRCETGLVNQRTKEPVVVEFEFRADGKGTGRIFERNNQCTGNAKGEITDKGELRIILDEQHCADSSSYIEQQIVCRNEGGIANCLGRNADGSAWDARFSRKR